MIESRYWRQELRRDVGLLRQQRQFNRWTERQQVLFERRLMLVAFQIRVLLERPKVSSHARKSHIYGRLYPKIGPDPVNVTNAAALEENFDLDNPKPIRLPVRELCNQLIHHYVLFAVRSDKQRFEMVLVFSDYKRNVCLYEFDVEAILDIFDLFSSEASAPYNDRRYVLLWDEKRQDYVWDLGA